MIVFELATMSMKERLRAWPENGQTHVIVKYDDEVPKRCLNVWYRYQDMEGELTRIHVYKLPSAKATSLANKSVGFCGKEWMVDSIIKYGRIQKHGFDTGGTYTWRIWTDQLRQMLSIEA